MKAEEMTERELKAYFLGCVDGLRGVPQVEEKLLHGSRRSTRGAATGGRDVTNPTEQRYLVKYAVFNRWGETTDVSLYTKANSAPRDRPVYVVRIPVPEDAFSDREAQRDVGEVTVEKVAGPCPIDETRHVERRER